METETDKIFKEQLRKLPDEIVDFISSTDWDNDLNEIGALYNLSENELSGFTREATIVVMGFVHPDAFTTILEQEVGIKGILLENLVDNVEKKIFAPIRPALIEFFDSEARKDAEQTPTVADEPSIPTASQSPINGQMLNVPRRPDIAPENLPIAETVEPFLPPIPLKNPAKEKEVFVHPFEEKMKNVFTTIKQPSVDPMVEQSAQTPSPTEDPKAPPIYHADPYREPIE